MKLRVGDRVRAKKDSECYFCKGRGMTVVKITPTSAFPVTCAVDGHPEGQDTEIFGYNALERIRNEDKFKALLDEIVGDLL